MTQLITFFVDRCGDFFVWLGTMSIVPGVSILGFLGALLIVDVMINNLLFRPK